MNRPDRFLHNQTKEIQRDFTRLAVTFEPNVLITQNINLVKDTVRIYHIIVNSNRTFVLVFERNKCRVSYLLLTHAVPIRIEQQRKESAIFCPLFDFGSAVKGVWCEVSLPSGCLIE